MASVDTVIPNSLNYTDIKPQAIENEIKLCRYQPVSNVAGAKGGDLVKFLISGNGFLDPYSTYFQFVVEVPDLNPGEVRWVDRSAHSFFSRIVIRSQGVEIERIENYDIIATMINDMIYSPEQCTDHYWEGLPTHQFVPNVTAYHQGATVGPVFQNYAQPGIQNNANAYYTTPMLDCRDELFRWLNQGASPSQLNYIGETCFHALPKTANLQVAGDGATRTAGPLDFVYFPDYTYLREQLATQGTGQFTGDGVALPGGINTSPYSINTDRNVTYPVSFGYHVDGRRVPASSVDPVSSNIGPIGTTKMRFMVPIYSGLIGLLMPEKKLLPLNLLPLDIEIVFNESALYSSQSNLGLPGLNGAQAIGKRNYIVSEFFLYGNTMFFESEIHRTLEASVADHGLFIYCNSFLSGPIQPMQSDNVPSTVLISMNLKSINSLHWVFLYEHWRNSPCARKLHFVSHNLTRMWLLNGTQLIPQYPITGNAGTSKDGEQYEFMISLYKAWNKMHDPQRDGSHHAYNTCGDQYAGQFDPIFTASGYPWGGNAPGVEGLQWNTDAQTTTTMMQIANKQANVGRCQYAISLEGEELGSDRTMITGRKSQYPFQMQMYSKGKFAAKGSNMYPFLRADFIVYIRPDLQIVTLGK